MTVQLNLDPSIFASLALLFGIAANFKALDGYSFLRRLISRFEPRLGVLYAAVLVTVLISPFILNDVVILILTPVLIRYAKQFRVSIAPLIVTEVCFTNIASSLTPLGNPQNILLWQASGISARQFVLGTWWPIAISGVLTAVVLYPFRKGLGGAREFPTSVGTRLPAIYLSAVAVIVFSLDIVGVSNVLALGLAFLLGFALNLRLPRQVVKEFDYKSLLILYALVGSTTLVVTLLQTTLVPYATPAASGSQPYSALFVGLVSNLVSNVPATQLMLGTVGVTSHAAPVIAVEAGLAGNIDPIASFANILALLMVKRSGLPVRRIIILQLVVGSISFLPALL